VKIALKIAIWFSDIPNITSINPTKSIKTDLNGSFSKNNKNGAKSVKDELSPHKFVPPRAAEWRQIWKNI